MTVMGGIYRLGALAPTLPEEGRYYVAPGAQVIGNVTLGNDVSVWFNAVLRGDNDLIEIGDGSNIQDGVVCHVDPGFPIHIGKNVTVGHKALIHGCMVGDGSLIGMGAVILNGARIGKGCLVGANALITEGKEIPDGSMVLGQPAKVVRQLDEGRRMELLGAAERYRERLKGFLADLAPI